MADSNVRASEKPTGITVRRRSFTVVYDDLLTQGMSARAWGVYCYLVGRPDGWECRTYHLQHVFAEGRDALDTSIRELVTLGLLVKESYLDGGLRRQRFVLDADRLERQSRRSDPAPGNPDLGEGGHFPDTDSPGSGSPGPGNLPVVKKEVPITDPPPPSQPPPSSLVEALRMVVVGHLPTRIANQLLAAPVRVACYDLARDGWAPETLTAAIRDRNWHGAQPGAVLAWLRELQPPKPPPKPLGCADCQASPGWIDPGDARPCPTCKPHIRRRRAS